MTQAAQERHGSFQGWRVLAAVTVANWVNFALYLVGLGPSVVPLQQEFGWSRTFITGAYSTAGLLGFVAPLFGYCVDRFGPRKMMLVGAFSSSGGALLCSLTDSNGIFWYAGWILLMGPTGVWLSYPTTNKVVSNWFLRRRGFAMGLLALAGAFSYIMAAVHGMLINAFGWRGNWLILAASSFVIYMVVIIFFVRNTPEETGWHQDGILMKPEERAARAVGQERQLQQVASGAMAQTTEYQFTIWQALRSYSAWLIFAAGFGAGVALQIQTTQQVPFLEGMGIDRVVAGAVLGAMGLCGAPGRFLVGWLIDRFGRGSIRYWYALAFIFEIAGLVILTQVTSVNLVWAFAVVFGIGQGMTVTTPLVMIANYFGSASYSTIYSTRLLVTRIATILAPIFAAWVYDTLGSYLLAFYVAIVMLAIVTVMILFAVPPKTPVGASPQ